MHRSCATALNAGVMLMVGALMQYNLGRLSVSADQQRPAPPPLREGVKVVVLLLVVVLLYCFVESLIAPSWQHTAAYLKQVVAPDHLQAAVATNNPVNTYASLVQEYGQPAVVDKCAGGFAVWRGDGVMPFARIEVRDEAELNLLPEPHYEYLYVSWRPERKYNMRRAMHLTSVAESLMYDPLTNTLTARSGDIRASTAALVVADRFMSEQLSLEEAQIVIGPAIAESMHNGATYNRYWDTLVRLLPAVHKSRSGYDAQVVGNTGIAL